MLLNPLPTEMIRKRAPRKAPGFRQTLGMYVCEHSVCVWGAVNQDFNFPIFLYSRIVLLESRNKMHMSPAHITGSCWKDGQNSAWVQIQALLLTSSDMLDNLTFHLFGQWNRNNSSQLMVSYGLNELMHSGSKPSVNNSTPTWCHMLVNVSGWSQENREKAICLVHFILCTGCLCF